MAQHRLQQISPHVHWLSPDSSTDRPALGVIAGRRGALLVDAGNSPAHINLLLAMLAERDLSEPRFAMLTHWHWDHVFGTGSLDVPTFASYETQRMVRVMAGLDWSDAALDERVAYGTEIAFCRDMIKAELPDRSALIIRPPDRVFATSVDVDLGGVTCHIEHVGGDHAPDSSIVYVPEDRVLFLGDCIYDDLYHGPRRLTTTQLFPLLERLLAFDAEFFLGGHDPEPIGRAAFEADCRLLETIGRAVQPGLSREEILGSLPALLDAPLTDDHAEIADAFLAGLALPDAPSVL